VEEDRYPRSYELWTCNIFPTYHLHSVIIIMIIERHVPFAPLFKHHSIHQSILEHGEISEKSLELSSGLFGASERA
jgi:hypothetical protein